MMRQLDIHNKQQAQKKRQSKEKRTSTRNPSPVSRTPPRQTTPQPYNGNRMPPLPEFSQVGDSYERRDYLEDEYYRATIAGVVDSQWEPTSYQPPRKLTSPPLSSPPRQQSQFPETQYGPATLASEEICDSQSQVQVNAQLLDNAVAGLTSLRHNRHSSVGSESRKRALEEANLSPFSSRAGVLTPRSGSGLSSPVYRHGPTGLTGRAPSHDNAFIVDDDDEVLPPGYGRWKTRGIVSDSCDEDEEIIAPESSPRPIKQEPTGGDVEFQGPPDRLPHHRRMSGGAPSSTPTGEEYSPLKGRRE